MKNGNVSVAGVNEEIFAANGFRDHMLCVYYVNREGRRKDEMRQEKRLRKMQHNDDFCCILIHLTQQLIVLPFSCTFRLNVEFSPGINKREKTGSSSSSSSLFFPRILFLSQLQPAKSPCDFMESNSKRVLLNHVSLSIILSLRLITSSCLSLSLLLLNSNFLPAFASCETVRQWWRLSQRKATWKRRVMKHFVDGNGMRREWEWDTRRMSCSTVCTTYNWREEGNLCRRHFNFWIIREQQTLYSSRRRRNERTRREEPILELVH